MNILNIIIQQLNLLRLDAKNEIQKHLVKDARLQISLAYLIEYDSGRHASLADWLVTLCQDQHKPETTFDICFFHHLFKLPELSWLHTWHTHNILHQTRPNKTLLDLFVYLLEKPNHTIDLFIDKIRPNHHNRNYYQNLQYTQSILNSPFLRHPELHLGKSTGFENPDYDVFYWSNALVYNFRLPNGFDPNVIRYSTYLEIIAQTIIQHDQTLKVYHDPSPLGSSLKHPEEVLALDAIEKHMKLYRTIKKDIMKPLVQMINEKRYQFGLAYFDAKTLKTIIHALASRTPKPYPKPSLFEVSDLLDATLNHYPNP